jgi:hypothetical protein
LAALAANDYTTFIHRIEGYRIARLGFGTAYAQPVTVSFWVNATVAGTMACTVRNVPGNRIYVTDVPVTGGIWEYKTLTVPGDTAGTWPFTNSAGMEISFCLGAGSAYRVTPPQTWTGATGFATPNTTNFFGANTNTVYLSGLTVHPGTQAPTSVQSPLIARSYDQELVLCRRYLWRRSFPTGTGYLGTLQAYSATLAGGGVFTLSPEMRIAPAITISSVGNFFATTSGGSSLGAVSLAWASTTDQVMLNSSTFATGLVGGNATVFSANAGAWLQMDARL